MTGKGERRSPPANPTYSAVPHLVLHDPRLDIYDRCVYAHALTRDWGKVGSKFFGSYKSIAFALGISPTKVQESLMVLLSIGLLTLTKRGGRGLANEYRVVQGAAIQDLYSPELRALIAELEGRIDFTDSEAVKALRQRQREVRVAALVEAREEWESAHRRPVGKAGRRGFGKERQIRELEAEATKAGEARASLLRAVERERRAKEEVQAKLDAVQRASQRKAKESAAALKASRLQKRADDVTLSPLSRSSARLGLLRYDEDA